MFHRAGNFRLGLIGWPRGRDHPSRCALKAVPLESHAGQDSRSGRSAALHPPGNQNWALSLTLTVGLGFATAETATPMSVLPEEVLFTSFAVLSQ